MESKKSMIGIQVLLELKETQVLGFVTRYTFESVALVDITILPMSVDLTDIPFMIHSLGRVYLLDESSLEKIYATIGI